MKLPILSTWLQRRKETRNAFLAERKAARKKQADEVYAKMLERLKLLDENLKDIGIKRISTVNFATDEVWTTYALLPSGQMTRIRFSHGGSVNFYNLQQ